MQTIMLRSLMFLMSSGGGVDLDMDVTVIGQVVLFVVLMLVLKPVLFDPMLKLFEEREKHIDGAKEESLRLDEESAEAHSKYESEMAKARLAANTERDKMRAEGARKEAEILAKVGSETEEVLRAGKDALLFEVNAASTELALEKEKIANLIASRVIGREV